MKMLHLYQGGGPGGRGNISCLALPGSLQTMPAQFRLDAQQFFLTYPHSTFDHEAFWNWLNSLEEALYCRIADETHESGEPHVHAVFKFKRRFQSRDAGVFDYQGRHPNIQRPRSLTKSLDYIAKDGRYTDFGAVPKATAKRDWSEIESAASQSEREWLQCQHEERIMPHVAKRLRELNSTSVYDLSEYDNRPISPVFETLPTEFRSLLVIGRPGIGKTGWAMQIMPRPCLLVKHIDCLRHFDASKHKSILFDDCEFGHLPRPTQLQLCDWENQVQIHVRYGVACIPAHIPRLFLCNPNHEPFKQDDAIQGRRLQVINISPF